MKIAYIDVETTGVDPNKHGIWQVAAEFFVDSNFVSKTNLMFKPDIRCCWQVEAYEMFLQHPASPAIESVNCLTSTEAYKAFCALVCKYIDRFDRKDKFIFAGYNAKFDFDFMHAWAQLCGDKYFGSLFFAPALDVAVVAMQALLEKRSTMLNFKQSTVAEELGIEIEHGKLHDAMYDVEITRRIHKTLILKEGGKSL